MRDSKSFASLSSGLLARKGAAKPAMRPQGFGNFGASLEDLGWNDMGQNDEYEPEPHHAPSPVAALTPATARPAPEPAVVVHQRALRDSFEAPQAPEAPEAAEAPVEAEARATVLNLPRRRGAVKTGTAKAAFTLRLDPQRHLKLRLACALTRCSAQQLVTGALDEYLNSLPELDALADRLPAETGKRSR
ncbi:MAG TPA: hypothetical protein VF655_04310 [Allosphingosinicella sp.]|jgi:hypothetical protein